MVKETIKYTDYMDVEREEDFYFNLSTTELIEMERTDPTGSLAKRLEGIVNAKDIMEILSLIEWVIQKSYGVRSEDGRVFRKNSNLVNDFVQSAAYQELYISFLDDVEKAINFINALIPKKLPKIFTEDKGNP